MKKRIDQNEPSRTSIGLSVVLGSLTLFIVISALFAWAWGMWEGKARQVLISDYPASEIDVDAVIGTTSLLGVENVTAVLGSSNQDLRKGRFKLRGEITRIVDENAFLMGFQTTEGREDQLLVIHGEREIIGSPLEEAAIVVVDGIIDTFDLEKAQRSTNAELDQQMLSPYEGEPALVVPSATTH